MKPASIRCTEESVPTPAGGVSSSQEWTKDGLVLKVSGTMREAETFWRK